MTNKIGIGVEAKIDTSGVEKKIDDLAQKINKTGGGAGSKKIDPVAPNAEKALTGVNKQLEVFLRLQRDLQRRLKETGQLGLDPSAIDMRRAYPGNAKLADLKHRQMMAFINGQPMPGPTPPGPRPGQGQTWGGIAAGAAQAGMRAAGPAGGVAAGALGTGMSAGFGAGLMGLIGGMLALGVGKIVSSAMEKIGEAESNAREMDTLKRTLGDVNVSFAALKSVVNSGADNLRITYAEAGKLAMQFTRLGNVQADQAKTLADELGVGVGMSRAFGMDPSQGVGVMGQMRGLGVTTNTQESRRFALLIGETIGKAGAFAKADEVMDAIAGFATSQTRQNLGVANVGDYAGMLSGMVGSRIPGLDVQGSAALIARINSALSGGGAKGEASQFFTGMVGDRMGLDPIQTQIMREGGAFATNDSMFGEGSAARRFGISGPSGGKTFLQGTLEMLREKYGHNKGLLAQATANHLGIGINQAMGILSIKPNEIGEMQGYADLGKMTSSGIGNLSKALYGSDDDRRALRDSLVNRSDVSEEDKKLLRGEGGTSRELLARLTAQYEQERTQGSDIRDSKNALDNIKTTLADQVVPLMTAMRHGIMWLAGDKGQKTSEEIMRAVVESDSAGRLKGISGRFDPQLADLRGRRVALSGQIEQLSETRITGSAMYLGKPELQAEARRKRAELEKEAADVEARITALSKEKADLIARENERRDAEIKRMEKEAADRALAEIKANDAPPSGGPTTAPTGAAPAGPGGRRYESGTRSAGASGVGLPEDVRRMLEAEDRRVGLPVGTMASVVMQETSGKAAYLNDPTKYHYEPDANGRRKSSAFGPFGILESTARKPGYGVDPLRDKSLAEQARFAADYLAARARAAGGLRNGLSGYGEGPAYGDSVMGRIGRYTPLPEGGMQPTGGGRYIFDAPPVDVNIRDGRGMIVGQTTISGRFRRATPFGSEVYA